MRAAEAYGELLTLGRPLVETREAAARLSTSLSGASHLLRSLEAAGLITRIRRGLWALRPDPEPFSIPPYLTVPFPAYVSYWSALARHGMIEQIPRHVSVASTGRSKRVTTSQGLYVVHHLTPELFDGYTGTPEHGYLATPAKALFDAVYLRAPAGGRPFFPEVTLPEHFDAENRLQEWLGRIPRSRLRTLVATGLSAAVRGAVTE
jgi:predicted transcriptional regulator of viral defense system